MTPIKRLLLLVILLGAVAGGFACSLFGDAWQPPLIVKVQSEKDVTALMPTWAYWHSVAVEGEPQGMLLRDGDYFVADEFFLRYLAADGLDLKITFNDWSARIGDKTVCILLEKDKKDGSAWLESATEQQLASVRTVSIGSEIDDGALTALKRLAAANPSVDLLVESSDGLLKALPLFRPRTVFAPEDADAGVLKTALANQRQIETLFFDAATPGSLDVIATLPKLRRLILSKWDVAKTGPLPAGVPSLRSLLVLESDGLTDLSPLSAAAAGLEELSVLGSNDGVTGLTGIEKMTHLRTLVLWGGEPENLSKLAELKNLRWVGLPPKTKQDQFAAFVNAHPELAILHITMGNDAVKDLSPLTSLKGLNGLFLFLEAPYEGLSVVQKLTSLRFVGISKDVWEKSPDQVAAIRKALPDALVVPVSPMCLGSGWILLLVPVTVVVWWIRRRRSLEFRM